MPSKSIHAGNLSAIRLAADLGRRIQEEHAEVVGMYRKLVPLSRIIKRLRLIKAYGVSEHVARNAVVYAVRGYHWGFGARNYEGLIRDAEELARIRSGYKRQTVQIQRRQKKESSANLLKSLERQLTLEQKQQGGSSLQRRKENVRYGYALAHAFAIRTARTKERQNEKWWHRS